MNKEMTATNYETNSGLENKNIMKNHHTHTGNLTSGDNQQQQQSNSLIMASTVASSTFIAPNSPSSSSSTSKNNGDSTFEPTVDMMVNDFDDEQTLEEEEALAAQEFEDPSAELSSLQKESDMPIEELLALYNCNGAIVGTGKNMTKNSSHNKRKLKPQRMTSSSSSNYEGSDGKSVIRGDQNEGEENEDIDEEDDEDDEDDDDNLKDSQLRTLYPETYGNSSDKRLLRTISRQQSDEEDDGEYSPDEDEFKKTIMVGSEFQAVIPEGFFKYDDVLPYENEDKLLWDPSRLGEKQTEEYLQRVKALNVTATGDTIPCGNHLRDDEQALYLLLQCGHNTEEALRRKRLNAVPSSSDEMSIWSEEECRNFESGIRIYGKDFYTIKHIKVRTRSVGELVQFYYLWKKTERHDVFANKARLEKKKYSLHPGLTDYMDRFLEEQESNNGSTTNVTMMNSRDRSSSPAIVNCLLQTDTKRQNLKVHLSSSSLNITSPVIITESGGGNTSNNSEGNSSFTNTSKTTREQENNSSTTIMNIGVTTSGNKLHSSSSLSGSNQAGDASINNTS